MIFPETFIDDFNKLMVRMDRIRTIRDLEACREKLCELMKKSCFEQITSLIKKMRDKSRERLLRLNEGNLHDFERLDAYVRNNTNYAAYTTRTVAPTFCLDRGKEESEIRNEETSYAFPVCRTGGLMAALRYMLRNSADIKSLVYGNGINEIEERINSLVQTANVISWFDEDKKQQEYSLFLKQIHFIKKHTNFEGLDSLEMEKLKYALQIVCAYSVQYIEISKSLQSLQIESISYFFSPATKSKLDSLILHINGILPISLEGIKARNLHKLLLKPKCTLAANAFEAKGANLTTKEKERLRDDFDEANIRICRNWNAYGFILGAYEFISDKKYAYSINHDLAHHIKPK